VFINPAHQSDRYLAVYGCDLPASIDGLNSAARRARPPRTA
jgi:hypothetical protein